MKLLAALTIVLIFAAVNNAHAQLYKPTIYKVRINVSQVPDPLTFAGKYYIGVVNDRHNLVAPVQPFRFGTFDYVFQETTLPLGNTRTALMEAAPNSVAPGGIVIDPATINGPFKQGMTYYFVLTPRKQGVHAN